jgi:uncharacterized protein (DUF433 family)
MSAPDGKIASHADLRNQPAYTLAEGARYLKLPTATLRAWAVGRAYPTARGAGHFRPLIRPARKAPPQLSFWNLIEAHVLRSFRAEHGVSLRALRQALDFAERELRIERLLLRRELCADAGELFLERYGELISLSASGQLAMRRLFDEHLKRVEWDEWKFPVRLYPFLAAELTTEARPIAIDPGISFGRPVIARLGISTAVLADRLDAGETLEDLTADYGLSHVEIEQAVLYERTA